MRCIGLAILVSVSLLAVAEQAQACTGEQPSFAEAIAGAGAIARVVVEEVTEFGEPPAAETYRVIRVLKGSLPDEVQLDDPRTGLCGDTIGYYAPEGADAVVAFGVPFYGTLINPVWIETDDQIEPVTGLGAPAPEDVASLDELEALILAAVPDTAMSVNQGGSAALLGGVLVLFASATVLSRRLRRTTPRSSAGKADRMSRKAAAAIAESETLAVADISWFELAWMARHERIALSIPMHSWLARLGAQVRTVPVTPAIAATAVSLPSTFPGDPADRLIYATAVENGWRVVTKDRRLRSHRHPRPVTLW